MESPLLTEEILVRFQVACQRSALNKLDGSIAQLVEQRTLTPKVVGSKPTGSTNNLGLWRNWSAQGTFNPEVVSSSLTRPTRIKEQHVLQNRHS